MLFAPATKSEARKNPQKNANAAQKQAHRKRLKKVNRQPKPFDTPTSELGLERAPEGE